jgi:hypothetical protein
VVRGLMETFTDIPMQARSDITMNNVERAGYKECSSAHLYTVLHQVTDPVARVLLVGPFASERNYSYVPWVRWARFLAERGIEALRYDYRGVGESTGSFEEVSFDDWREDVEFLAKWVRSLSPDLPLILHGLELGALLASQIFATGVGDALLLWAAPANANEVLRTVLLRHVAADSAFKDVADRKPASDYIRQLEAEQSLEVEGYQWSGRLWRDSFELELALGKDDERASTWACGRPVRRVKLDKSAAPLVKGSSLGYLLLNPDLTKLFADNFEWITTNVSTPRRMSSEISH